MKKSIWPIGIKQKLANAWKTPKMYDLNCWWEEDMDIFVIKILLKDHVTNTHDYSG